MNSDQNKTVIGIDPGSRFVGFGVIEKVEGQWKAIDYGLIRLPQNQPLSKRLNLLGSDLDQLFAKYHPSLTVIEKIFLGRNVSSAFTLGHARGVILSIASRFSSEIREYAPTSVKKGITGHGAAQKEQVMMMVQAALSIPRVEKDDVSDALAMALYGARQLEISRKFAEIGGVEL